MNNSFNPYSNIGYNADDGRALVGNVRTVIEVELAGGKALGSRERERLVARVANRTGASRAMVDRELKRRSF